MMKNSMRSVSHLAIPLFLVMVLSGQQQTHALGPHEVLVIANRHESESVQLAKAYVEMRSIPKVNLIKVDLGETVSGSAVSFSREVFTERIWEPVHEVMRERGLDSHILAWVYSTHIPFRVETEPFVSLQGITFVRNQLPPPQAITDGSYRSPIFRGPDRPGGNRFASSSFDMDRRALNEKIPIPSMSLGYIGPNGNTKEEILAMLNQGIKADGTHPTGTVYYVVSDDIRSSIREWQFKSAVEELQQRGVFAVITNAMPEKADSVLGIMSGRAVVDPERVGRIIPGAMAEHLTSFAGAFDKPTQTKLSRWIAAGATGSAGAVDEPMSVFTKFPNARFFKHYQTGCTMMESFYYSIQSPMQLIIVGDPLCTPWRPEASMHLQGLEQGHTLSKVTTITPLVETSSRIVFRDFHYFLNGRPVAKGAFYRLNPENLPQGTHTLRVVAYSTGLLRHQVFTTVSFPKD